MASFEEPAGEVTSAIEIANQLAEEIADSDIPSDTAVTIVVHYGGKVAWISTLSNTGIAEMLSFVIEKTRS